METKEKQQLTSVVNEMVFKYGPDEVAKAIEELAIRGRKALPLEAYGTITPQGINSLIAALDTTVGDLLAAGQKKAEAYQDKAELMKQLRELENEIKITEATALMDTDGKTATVNGKVVALNNQEARDAYRRLSSKDLRAKRAEVEGKIARIDVMIQKANDDWYTIKEAGDKIQAKAQVFAGLLKWNA
jgi:hypothetical protein